MSKLINKKHPNDDFNISLACMYCHRWATYINNEEVCDNKIVWKKYEELSEIEQSEVHSVWSNGNVASHGVCNQCMDIMNNLYPFEWIPEDIKEKSLKNGEK